MDPKIRVEPQRHLLVDDPLHITVTGLPKSAPVTLYALLVEDDKKFESMCCFTSDSDGNVDLTTHASQSGTYMGVSAMGLFWSMVPCAGQLDGIRLMKKNMDTPFKTTLKAFPGHISREQCTINGDKDLLCSAVIERFYKAPGVRCLEVHHGRIRGKLFLPPGPGPHRGLVDLFGSVGGIVEYRSALLASRGFASLALPYIQYKDLVKSLSELDLDYFIEAVDWLTAQDNVMPDALGVIGVSRGGDIALLMAVHHPKVKAVVNINGCTFCPTQPLKYSGGDIAAVKFDLDKAEMEDGKYIVNKCFDYQPEDIIKVWKSEAKILNILSEDDLCAPKESIRLLKSLYPADKTHNFIVEAYDKAGHLVEPPYTPLCRYSYNKYLDVYSCWGGYPKEHAFAQEDSWRKILQFFDNNLQYTIPDANL